MSLGKPTTTAVNCEQVKLPWECANSTDVDTTKTTQEIIDLALAGAATNGVTWANGDPITGAAPENIYRATACVVCSGTPVTEDDGTVFTPDCDAGSVVIAPNGGTNVQSYSCGSDDIELGGGSDNTEGEIRTTDTVTVIPGGAASGHVWINRCRDKSGNLI